VSAADPEALLAALVAFPTIAGRSNLDMIDWVAERLDEAGADCRIVPAHRDDARGLHAVIGPVDVGGGTLLSAHSDVVDVAGQPWTTDPFALTGDGGRLYGRGSTDMKGFLAAALAAVPGVGPGRLRRPLHLALSADEELGCLGTPSLLEALRFAPGTAPAVCIVGEPTSLRVVVRHKGKAGFRVVVRGRACHSSVATDGVNAVEVAAELIVALRALGTRLTEGPADPAFRAPHATVSTGPITGGISTNVVPDHCTFDFEIRTLPGQSPAAALAPFDGVVADARADIRARAPEGGITVQRLAGYPGLGGAPEDAAATRVAGLAGTAVRPAVDFGTEAGLLSDGLGVPCVICGPGDMARGHRADEYLERAELAAAVSFLGRVVDDLARV
jgi:acetylornithine deacetylase